MSSTPSSTRSPATSPRSRPARLGRLVGGVAVLAVSTAAGLLLLAGTASAHVTAHPGDAAQGSYTKVSFRTPNEEDSAATVKLEVSLPADHPIASVSTEPVPGWTASVEKVNLPTPLMTDDGEITQAVSKITWSGGQLAPGQFQDFNVSLGPLPTDTDKLVFKAVQTYSNGDVVRWIEDTPAGGPEPEHPAPTITLTKATTGDSPAGPAAAAPAPPGSSATPALALGILGAVLGLVGAILGALALRRRGAHAGG